MLVPDHCVHKGQHSTFDDSWTRSYLRAWEKFADNVTNSIILVTCGIPAILRLKSINNKSIDAIELSKIPRDIWGRVALSKIIPRTNFGRGDVVQQPSISRSYLGYWAYRIYLGERSDRYGYIFIFPRAGQEIAGEILFFFSFFYFPQSALLKDMCILLLMKPAFIFEHIFYPNTSLAFPKFIR